MSKNILITGASGFIGSFLVETALRKSYRTVAGIRGSSSRKYLQDPAIGFVELDFASDEALDRAILQFKQEFGSIDYVIHNAGITRAKQNAEYDIVNCDNTRRFVEALQRNQAVPQKFVMISSLAAYGPAQSASPVKPQDQKSPLTAYGRSKWKAEQYLYSTADFPFIIINPTAVYGPKDKDVFFLIQSIEKGFEIYIGNDAQQLSFVHVQDLCEAIFIAMESDLFRQNFLISDLQRYTSRIFNTTVKQILGKRTLSIIVPVGIIRAAASIAELIGNMTGKVPVLNRERLKEFEAPNWTVDSTEIAELGYTPEFNLQSGLAHAIEWYRKEGWIRS